MKSNRDHNKDDDCDCKQEDDALTATAVPTLSSTSSRNLSDDKDGAGCAGAGEGGALCPSCDRYDCPCGPNCQCGSFCDCPASGLLAALGTDGDGSADDDDFNDDGGDGGGGGAREGAAAERGGAGGVRYLFRATLSVDGMTCQSCVRTVENVIRQNLPPSSLRAGAMIKVNLGKKNAIVDVRDVDEATKIAEEIDDAGFESQLVSMKIGSTLAPPLDDEGEGDADKLAGEDMGGEDEKKDDSDFASAANATASILAASTITTTLAQHQQHKLKKKSKRRLTFAVTGMTCSVCSNAVRTALEQHFTPPGCILSARINLATEYAVVEYDASLLPPGREGVMQIVKCVEDAGYGVDLSSGDLPLALDETSQDDFNDDDEEGQKQHLLLNEGPDRAAELDKRQTADTLRKRNAFLWSLLGTGPILIITMVLRFVPSNPLHDFWDHEIVDGFTLESLILWVLCTPVQFISGHPFYRGAYHGLRNRMLGMDTLVALGTTAAYIYAVVLVSMGIKKKESNMGAHFFETSAVLISFVLLGKWLQTRAVRRTSLALTRLLGLQSRTALKVLPRRESNDNINDGGSNNGNRVDQGFDPSKDPYDEEEVLTDTIVKGDIIKLIRGSSIPADGKLISGDLTVNESMITGESMPVYKTVGADVLGGTVCVEGISFASVTGVGSDTALGRIARLVEDAQMNRAPIQEFADQVSSIFVPAVCLISASTFAVWVGLGLGGVVPDDWKEDKSSVTFALIFALATLVISCPCALGLATPTAVMVGTGVGASHGILIKGGEQLQKSSQIGSVILDKTGTVTEGRPCITDFVRVGGRGHKGGAGPTFSTSATATATATAVDPLTDEELLWLLGSLERNSEHPLAAAIVAFAEGTIPIDRLREKPFAQPTDFLAVTGKGVSCTVEGTSVALGNRGFLASKRINVPDEAETSLVELERVGKTAVLAAVDGTVAVVIGISDEIKPDSAASIRYLRDVLNVDVWLVTGDNGRTARAVSHQLGLSMDRVVAEALPAAKLKKVKELQAEGGVVAMVGDGINDSPALAQADVGVSIGTGAEIAAEAADVVLVRGRIGDVCVAIDLSKTIFNRIRLNFVWALIYNCLGIPIAAGVFYPLVQVTLPPTVAAVAMVLSSLSVVASSLALKLYAPPNIHNLQKSRSYSHYFRCLFCKR